MEQTGQSLPEARDRERGNIMSEGGTREHDYDWLIVGGGIHGVHIAACLIGGAGLSAEQVCIVDPESSLLTTWRERVAATGMIYLRSPVVHHLDVHPWSLRDFISAHSSWRIHPYTAPYDRPSVEAFDAHCDEVIARYRLERCHRCDSVTDLELHTDGVHIELASGDVLFARRVVLAVGGTQVSYPDWLPTGSEACVTHMFERGDGSGRDISEAQGQVVVVGGGVSAAQLALRLSQMDCEVHMVARHALRIHQFDSDPGWLGPKFMSAFDRETCVKRRRQIIKKARNTGSVTPQLHRHLERAERRGALTLHQGEIMGLTMHEEERGGWLLLDSGALVRAEHVYLATGFEPTRPGGELVERLIRRHDLPCAPCQFPHVDRTLRWMERLYVSGGLAELELGPTAKNISGARRAGERLMQVALADDGSAYEAMVA